MIIESLIRINRGLPDYNYYLDVGDFLIKDNLKIKNETQSKLSKKIEEIEKYLKLAFDFFEEERNTLNETQIRGFILKKNLIKNNLELLKTLNLKYCKKFN